MASSLKKEPSEERIKMEENQWPHTPGHPGYGQTLSEPETPSNSGIEGEGDEVGRNSFGILSGGRPVRLVLYDRHQEDNTRTIWIDFKSTYSDIANELTEIFASRTFVMLEPIWGPLPCWMEANPDSLIGTTCHTLYVVLESESVGHILGVVRTSLSDYPIAIWPFEPSATVSEAVIASHPKLSDQIKSITGFTDDQIIKDTQGGYDSLRQYASSRASVVIMTVDEPPTQFMSDLPDESIPPLLQVSFAYCKCLMQWGHDQDFFALQIIHILRAILHTIISLALRMEKFFEEDTPVIETTLYTEDDIADLRVAPLLSHELQTLLRKLNGIMETLGGGHFDADDIQKRLDNTFDAVCADYPGAVTTRRSYGLFKRLGRIDHEEMQINAPRGVAGRPVPNPNTGKIEERLEESKIKEDTPMGESPSVAEYPSLFNSGQLHSGWNQQASPRGQVPDLNYANSSVGNYQQNTTKSAPWHHMPPIVNSIGPNATPKPGSLAWLSNCTMSLSSQQRIEVEAAYEIWRPDIERQILVVNMYCDWFEHQRPPRKDALLKFYWPILAPSKGGQGARGGAVGYTCEWPGCLKSLGGRTDRAHDHALAHLNIKIFVCDDCRASFLRKHELNRHFKSCKLRLPNADSLFLSIASTSLPASKRLKSQRSLRGVSADIPPSTSGEDSPNVLPGESAENPTSSPA